LNVPYANERLFPAALARETREKRDYHNSRLHAFCLQHSIPLVDICARLSDEHLGDHLHPNASGAKAIAEQVFVTLSDMQRKT
jgi:hypothetical protein